MTSLRSAPLPPWLFFFFGGKSAFLIAPESDSPLMRWAAQSALISVQGMPQTFSVYVLKKIWKRREPNSFVTHSWRLRGFLFGKARAFAYEATQRAASNGPS